MFSLLPFPPCSTAALVRAYAVIPSETCHTPIMSMCRSHSPSVPSCCHRLQPRPRFSLVPRGRTRWGTPNRARSARPDITAPTKTATKISRACPGHLRSGASTYARIAPQDSLAGTSVPRMSQKKQPHRVISTASHAGKLHRDCPFDRFDFEDVDGTAVALRGLRSLSSTIPGQSNRCTTHVFRFVSFLYLSLPCLCLPRLTQD